MTKILKKVQLNTEQTTSQSADPTKGTQTNPYTQVEMTQLQEEGTWNGGYVEGMGYIVPVTNFILPTIYIYGDIREHIIYVARQYLGINNRENSDLINSWLQAVGCSYPDPWCAAFVSAVFNEADANGANSAAVYAWAIWGHQTTDPKPGDIAIYTWSHVGIITNVSGNMITVIAGNSQKEDDPFNRYVTEKTLSVSNFSSFRSDH